METFKRKKINQIKESQRKNQKRPQWEAVLRIDKFPSVSPHHLLKHYVALTALLVPAGSLLLRQLKRPFSPLAANTVGSIPKNISRKFGVATEFWGPHSTRGA